MRRLHGSVGHCEYSSWLYKSSCKCDPHLSLDDVDCGDELAEEGPYRTVRPDQKTAELIKAFVQNFPNPFSSSWTDLRDALYSEAVPVPGKSKELLWISQECCLCAEVYAKISGGYASGLLNNRSG